MNLNVVFLDCTSGYGYSFSAVNTKTEFMVLGLKDNGAYCTVINSVVGINEVHHRTVLDNGICNIISYPKKGNQLVSWLKNVDDLKTDLQRLYHRKCTNIIVLESPDYHIYRLYCHYSHKYGYKIVTISHEWSPTIKSIHPLRRPFKNLYTRTFGFYSDAILPISEYIIDKIKYFRKPYLKVPVLASFDEVPAEKGLCEDYFLYCVYAAYTRVIIPIIEAYMEYRDSANGKYKLILVLGGSDTQVNVIIDYLNQHGYEKNVSIRRKVPYDELMRLYKNAAGLIIPLDPNAEQDYARFSQKIAEYTSSASPIISCKVGEVGHYFKDKESAILCEYSKKGFVNAFSWITEHPLEAECIGKKGYEVGENYFNYKIVGKQLFDFLVNL